MRKLINGLMFLSLLSVQACQVHTQKQGATDGLAASIQQDIGEVSHSEQMQLHTLILQSVRYQKQNKQQRKLECARLKKSYAVHADWHTAWLLVYALNENFSCVGLTQSLRLLNAIQQTPDLSAQLRWLNKNQIDLLAKLRKVQKAKNALTNQLKKENSKIEALKAIESDIKDKLDNE